MVKLMVGLWVLLVGQTLLDSDLLVPPPLEHVAVVNPPLEHVGCYVHIGFGGAWLLLG